jgi:diguanylate cyclase (GGDEF)-like protein/PAS domain S-box-containing protein
MATWKRWGCVTTEGATERRVDSRSSRAVWWFLGVGVAVALGSLLVPSDDARSFVFDALSLAAAGAAVYGIMRNDPPRRGMWQLFTLALVLFAAGDVVFDVALRGFGQNDGYPYADVLYLLAYPVLAIALVRLARSRFDRATLIDSAVVAVTLSAVIWQWVVTPVLESEAAPALERFITVLYPLVDILLVVVIVHAVFTLPRWTAAAWLLFVGLACLLVGDALFARFLADGTYTDGGALDALWPIAYLLLAAAVMHPSMRQLWEEPDVALVRHGRARMIVLGTALFAVPAVVLLDDTGSGTAVVLAIITGVAAVAVAWRITRIVDESNHARVVLAASEARFRALVQHATDIVIVLDSRGTVTYISPAVDAVFGNQPDDLVGSSFVDYLDDAGVAQSTELYQRLVEHPEEPVPSEFSVVLDGKERWVEATWTNQLHEPAVAGIVGNLRDITDRKRANAFGQDETRVFELILSGAPVPETLETLVHALERYIPDGVGSIRLLDPETRQLRSVAAPSLPAEYVHEVSQHTTVADIEAFLSATETRVLTDIERDGARPDLNALCIANGLRGMWSTPIRSPDGSEFLGLFAFFVRTVRQPRASELAILERARDLAALAIDRDARTKELGHLALHDPLTGLPNRALAQDRLEHALERLAHSDDRLVAVLFVDLDRFKLVNDGLGHETGDELLVAVGRRLATTVRRQDTIARIGGDEFVVLCEDLREEAQAVELAERAAQALAEPFPLSRAEVTVSASIGIAVTNRASERAANLLQDADAAMYRAKRRGGARHELFDEAMHTQAVSRLLTERALRRALDRDELRVLFQPEFDLSTGSRVAVEALLRWEHPVRGLITPGDFLRVAEETGIIVPMGAWVFAQACEVARGYRHQGDGEPVVVSTNVSTRQLQRPDFAELVARTARDAGVDPGSLRLEVSESALLDELDATADALRALKDVGVQLAIDDFGTGGSSLTYLRRFPFDELKIDRMFVEGLGRSAADDAIVAATIDMAHALDMVVSAEGVETEEQRVRLVDLGCDRAQGFHLGAPEALTTPRLLLVREEPA